MIIIRVDNSNASIVFDLFDRYRMFYHQPSDIVLAKNFILERLNNNESIIFVAWDEKNSKPVGFTQLYPVYSSVRAVKNWLLNDLFVDETYRKQGIGEKLIRAAMHFAKDNHAKYVELSTATDNHIAQKLYEQIGFTKQVTDTDFYSYRMGLL